MGPKAMQNNATAMCPELRTVSDVIDITEEGLDQLHQHGRLSLFENRLLPNGEGKIAFVGGPVSALDFHPWAKGICAIAAHRNDKRTHKILKCYEGSAHIQIWGFSNGFSGCLGVIEHKGNCTWDVKWRPEESERDSSSGWEGTVAAALGDGTVLVALVDSFTQTSFRTEGARVERLSPKSTLLRVNKNIANRSPVRVVEWSKDGNLLVVGSADGSIEVYDATCVERTWPKWSIPGHESVVMDLRWLSETHLCSLGLSCVLRLRDIRDPVSTLEQNMEGLSGSLSMDTPEANVAVVGGDYGYLRVVRLSGTDGVLSRQPVKRVRLQSGSFRDMRSIPVSGDSDKACSQTLLYTGGADGMLHECKFPRPIWASAEDCEISKTRIAEKLRWKQTVEKKEWGEETLTLHLHMGKSIVTGTSDGNKHDSENGDAASEQDLDAVKGEVGVLQVDGPMEDSSKPVRKPARKSRAVGREVEEDSYSLFGVRYNHGVVINRIALSGKSDMLAAGISGGVVTWMPLSLAEHERDTRDARYTMPTRMERDSVMKPPRKRGKPRKFPQLPIQPPGEPTTNGADVTSTVTVASEERMKRGRGRPRSVPRVFGPKRKRGRPRKMTGDIEDRQAAKRRRTRSAGAEEQVGSKEGYGVARESPAASMDKVQDSLAVITDEVQESPSAIMDDVQESPAAAIMDDAQESPAAAIIDEVQESPAAIMDDAVLVVKDLEAGGKRKASLHGSIAGLGLEPHFNEADANGSERTGDGSLEILPEAPVGPIGTETRKEDTQESETKGIGRAGAGRRRGGKAALKTSAAVGETGRTRELLVAARRGGPEDRKTKEGKKRGGKKAAEKGESAATTPVRALASRRSPRVQKRRGASAVRGEGLADEARAEGVRTGKGGSKIGREEGKAKVMSPKRGAANRTPSCPKIGAPSAPRLPTLDPIATATTVVAKPQPRRSPRRPPMEMKIARPPAPAHKQWPDLSHKVSDSTSKDSATKDVPNMLPAPSPQLATTPPVSSDVSGGSPEPPAPPAVQVMQPAVLPTSHDATAPPDGSPAVRLVTRKRPRTEAELTGRPAPAAPAGMRTRPKRQRGDLAPSASAEQKSVPAPPKAQPASELTAAAATPDLEPVSFKLRIAPPRSPISVRLRLRPPEPATAPVATLRAPATNPSPVAPRRSARTRTRRIRAMDADADVFIPPASSHRERAPRKRPIKLRLRIVEPVSLTDDSDDEPPRLVPVRLRLRPGEEDKAALEAKQMQVNAVDSAVGVEEKKGKEDIKATREVKNAQTTPRELMTAADGKAESVVEGGASDAASGPGPGGGPAEQKTGMNVEPSRCGSSNIEDADGKDDDADKSNAISGEEKHGRKKSVGNVPAVSNEKADRPLGNGYVALEKDTPPLPTEAKDTESVRDSSDKDKMESAAAALLSVSGKGGAMAVEKTPAKVIHMQPGLKPSISAASEANREASDGGRPRPKRARKPSWKVA